MAAEEKDVMATLARPFIFPPTVHAAINVEPCALIRDWIIICPMEYRELLSPSGRPTDMTSFHIPKSTW